MLLATLSGLTTLIGVALAVDVSRSTAWIAIGIGFSVGIMLLISVLELIPQSLLGAGPVGVVAAIAVGSRLIAVLHYLILHPL